MSVSTWIFFCIGITLVEFIFCQNFISPGPNGKFVPAENPYLQASNRPAINVGDGVEEYEDYKINGVPDSLSMFGDLDPFGVNEMKAPPKQLSVPGNDVPNDGKGIKEEEEDYGEFDTLPANHLGRSMPDITDQDDRESKMPMHRSLTGRGIPNVAIPEIDDSEEENEDLGEDPNSNDIDKGMALMDASMARRYFPFFGLTSLLASKLEPKKDHKEVLNGDGNEKMLLKYLIKSNKRRHKQKSSSPALWYTMNKLVTKKHPKLQAYGFSNLKKLVETTVPEECNDESGDANCKVKCDGIICKMTCIMPDCSAFQKGPKQIHIDGWLKKVIPDE